MSLLPRWGTHRRFPTGNQQKQDRFFKKLFALCNRNLFVNFSMAQLPFLAIIAAFLENLVNRNSQFGSFFVSGHIILTIPPGQIGRATGWPSV